MALGTVIAVIALIWFVGIRAIFLCIVAALAVAMLAILVGLFSGCTSSGQMSVYSEDAQHVRTTCRAPNWYNGNSRRCMTPDMWVW